MTDDHHFSFYIKIHLLYQLQRAPRKYILEKGTVTMPNKLGKVCRLRFGVVVSYLRHLVALPLPAEALIVQGVCVRADEDGFPVDERAHPLARVKHIQH